jgi:predicted DNA-binding WGR domain protein
MRRYEYSDGKSSKFWQIEQQGSALCIAWGKIGTQGQSQVKAFADEAKAGAAMGKLILEKTGKGYLAVGDAAGSTLSASASKTDATGARACDAPISPRGAPAPAPITAHAADDIPWPEAPLVDAVALSGLLAALVPIAAGDAQPDDWLTDSEIKALTGLEPWRTHPQALALAADWVAHSALCKPGYACARSIGDVAAAGCWLLPFIEAQAAPGAPSLARQWRHVCGASAATQAQASPSEWLGGDQPLATSPALHRNWRPGPPMAPAAAWAVLRSIREAPGLAGIAAPTDGAAHEAKVREQLLNGVDEDTNPELATERRAMAERLIQQMRRAGDGAGRLAALPPWLASPSPPPAAPALEAVLLALLMHEADEAAPGSAADQRLLAMADLLVQRHSWPDVLEIVKQACCFDVHTGAMFAIEPRDRLRRPVHGVLAARLHAGLFARLGADELHACNAQALAALGDPDAWDERYLRLLVLPLPPLPLYGDAGGGWFKRAAQRTDTLWLSQLLQAIAARPDAGVLLAGLGQEAPRSHGPLRQQLAAVPHLAAFRALAQPGTDERALNLAIARWPLLAVVGLTRLLATARTPLPKLQSHFDRTLPRLAPVLDQLPGVLAPWLGKTEQAWLAERCQRLQGPAEVAAAHDLPAVLAAPPWLGKGKKAGAVPHMAVPPLAWPSALDWSDEARAQVLAANRHGAIAAPGSVPLEKQVHDLGFDNMHHQVASRERATRAVQAGDAQALIEAWSYARSCSGYVGITATALAQLPQALQLPFWNATAGMAATYDVEEWMAHVGADGTPGLVRIMQGQPGEHWRLALRMGHAAMAPVAARGAFKHKRANREGRAWLLKWPAHAAAGLVPIALAKSGSDKDAAGRALRFLAANGHRELLLQMAARHEGGQKVADAVQALIDLDPLSLYPSKLAPLPVFWRPAAWARPVLRNGKALGDDALNALGQMLAFPRAEGLYAGLDQVREACTPESLADFAWDLFTAWLAADAPAKENWAFTTLGLFGGDAAARKLTPLIRAWPGESAHARAVLGLDVLEQIGTDTALMLLGGIAQKVKFKGLQDKAREKIAAIAEARDLSPEELEDRLAPDLGLDEQGSLVLDFGPRQFRIGFDEALKPRVRDFTNRQPGARLKDLPKPNKADDEPKAKEATERYKLLKKDAKTIASQQIQRLETAMCQQRRWTEANFRDFIATHPLVRHIAQRLIWGVFAIARLGDNGDESILPNDVQDGAQGDVEADFPSHGGQLLACFRLAEDGSYTTADDEPFTLPEAPTGQAIRIGVPHALHIAPADAQAFGQLFADYELLQPFAQIGRDTYALTEAERQGVSLARWDGAKVPAGKVMGLFSRGWQRGQVQDGGCMWYVSKPLGDGRVIELGLDPGFIAGLGVGHEDQNLRGLHLGTPGSWGEMGREQLRPWSELDEVSASELVRDLEALRAPV